MVAAEDAAKLQPDAYCTIMLHACKHPCKAVNGLLLGSVSGASVSVRKALPLFHSSFALGPFLEMALTLVRTQPRPACIRASVISLARAACQADEHCKLSDGLAIVGYYQANEMGDDMELGAFGKKIAEKLRAACPQAAILMVDGSKMRATPTDLRLLQLGVEGKRGECAPPTVADAEATIAKLDAYIGRGVAQQLVDFDAHLDDGKKDWLNAGLFS